PFESTVRHRQLLHQFLPGSQESHIKVVSGPASSYLWEHTRFAMTVQSTTAMECAALGIPVFLCAWLRDPFAAYVEQYTRFGIGHRLHFPEEIADIPRLLLTQSDARPMSKSLWQPIDPEELHNLLSGTRQLASQFTG